MGFNRRKLKDQHRAAVEKEAANQRATDAQVLEDAERLIAAWNERQAKGMPMLFSTLKKSLDEVRAKRADPWHPRLEAVRGKVGDDGVERISTHTLFDILEVPQRSRTAGACRRLAKLMRDLGWSPISTRPHARRLQRSGAGLGEG